MRKSILLSMRVAASLLSVIVLVGTMPAQATHTTQHLVKPFDFTFQGCSGDDVHAFGTVDVVVQATTNGNGSTLIIHDTPHLTAVGVVSGLTYQAHGPSTLIENVHKGSNTTFTNIVRLVSQGSAPNLQFVEVFHFTVNANGDVSVSFDDFKGGCRG